MILLFTVRLVNGPSSHIGLFEIYHDGQFGTVCDDYWSTRESIVVCRQLGYSSGSSVFYGTYGQGTGTIWMDDVDCVGPETTLAECPQRGWGSHNCWHGEDVGVSCGK